MNSEATKARTLARAQMYRRYANHGIENGATVCYMTPTGHMRYGVIKEMELSPSAKSLVVTSNGDHWIEANLIRPAPHVHDPIAEDQKEIYGEYPIKTRSVTVKVPAVVLMGALSIQSESLGPKLLRHLCAVEAYSDGHKKNLAILWAKTFKFKDHPTMSSRTIIVQPFNGDPMMMQHAITGAGGYIMEHNMLVTQDWSDCLPSSLISSDILGEGLDYNIQINLERVEN